MENKISASILSSNFGYLQEEVSDVERAGVDMIHIDVMDGHFVPNITFGAPVIRQLKTDLPLDIHLMIENPENFIKDFAVALPGGRKPNGDIITVHAETCKNLHQVVAQIKEAGFRACVAINPATPLSAIEEVVEIVDQVLIMSVNPGYSGQKFMSSVLEKVRELRANMPNLDIEIDGGIDDATSVAAREAGANVLVSASYLFGAPDKSEAVGKLRG